MLVRELLAEGPAAYPPSLGRLVAFLSESAWFREASARVVQKPRTVPSVLNPAKFASADRFAGLRIPRIATPGDLAKWLNIPIEHLVVCRYEASPAQNRGPDSPALYL
jgi:hypothetical protein